MLQTMQPFLILSRCSLPTTFLLPAEKTTTLSSAILNVMALCREQQFGTCAGDDHVHLSDHFIQLNHSEAIHAERRWEKKVFTVFWSVLLQRVTDGTSSTRTRPEGHRWDPPLSRTPQRSPPSAQRSSLCRPAGRETTTARLLPFFFTYIYMCRVLLTSPYPHTATCLPPNMKSVVLLNLKDQLSTMRQRLRLHPWNLAPALRTRPVETPCSSKGCRISAWSPSRSRSWREHSACRPSTAGISWDTGGGA